jgi:hypothetical protein
MNLTEQKVIFRKTLEANHPEESHTIWHTTDTEFRELQTQLSFIRESKNPMDSRLETAALFLALITTMHKKSYSFDEIRSICLKIASELVRPKSKFHFFLKRLLTKVVTTTLIQTLLKRKIEKTKMPSGSLGFAVEYVSAEKGKFLFGFDIVECGICKLFKKNQQEAYARILCEVDYMTSEIAGLTLLRTNTIANGGARCDFRFAYKKT